MENRVIVRNLSTDTVWDFDGNTDIRYALCYAAASDENCLREMFEYLYSAEMGDLYDVLPFERGNWHLILGDYAVRYPAGQIEAY